MGTPDEAELLARCLRGDARAWDELFDTHYAAMGRFVFQLGYHFSVEDVEEICQETFLTVIKSLSSFQGNSRFQTWLFRIAANRARDYLQKQTAAKRGGGSVTVSIHDDSSEHGLPVDPPSLRPGPDGTLMETEDLAMVGVALATLGGPCQEIIELRYFADLSYEEIAASLALNPKTVSSRLSKCLDKLQVIAKNLLSRENKHRSSV